MWNEPETLYSIERKQELPRPSLLDPATVTVNVRIDPPWHYSTRFTLTQASVPSVDADPILTPYSSSSLWLADPNPGVVRL